jgi:hypothetical protein
MNTRNIVTNVNGYTDPQHSRQWTYKPLAQPLVDIWTTGIAVYGYEDHWHNLSGHMNH